MRGWEEIEKEIDELVNFQYATRIAFSIFKNTFF